MDLLLKNLKEIKDAYQAEGIKVYYRDEADYTIKIIKDGTNFKTFRKRNKERPQFDFDIERFRKKK